MKLNADKLAAMTERSERANTKPKKTKKRKVQTDPSTFVDSGVTTPSQQHAAPSAKRSRREEAEVVISCEQRTAPDEQVIIDGETAVTASRMEAPVAQHPTEEIQTQQGEKRKSSSASPSVSRTPEAELPPPAPELSVMLNTGYCLDIMNELPTMKDREFLRSKSAEEKRARLLVCLAKVILFPSSSSFLLLFISSNPCFYCAAGVSSQLGLGARSPE
jgi:hypothetical protein